jgi:hypothetical protein
VRPDGRPAGTQGAALLIEHTDKAGAKILISGAGRCNFTDLGIAPERYLSQNPQFCRSALSSHSQADFIGMVESYGIA